MINPKMLEELGARARPKLVNRTEVLGEIQKAIESHPHSCVFYITGDGGIGKTFLIREILHRCREGGAWYNPNLVVAQDVVDLYHLQTHSIEGFTRTMRDLLPAASAYLGDYNQKLAQFNRERFHLAGMLREISSLRDGIARAFLEGLNQCSKNKRLVIALDTAEKLLYETDEIQEILKLEEEAIAIQSWLLAEFLPNLENAVVLIGGRPYPERLRKDLRDKLGERLHEVHLTGFKTEEDAVNYFAAVAEAEREAGRIQNAERIVRIPEEKRKVMWKYAGGRPILLSLMIDYLVVADELIPAVKVSWEEASAKDDAELNKIQETIQKEIIRRLQETGSVTDEAIRALAYARKGLDTELLVRITGVSQKEAQNILQKLRDFSFVKVRRDDQRIFLHDELYDLFQEYVLDRLPRPQRDKVYETILGYYEDKIREARQKLAELQPREVERMGRPQDSLTIDASQYAEIQTQLYTLMVEEVYYRLRYKPVQGFQSYRIYRREGFWANDDNLDMQLRSELLDFLRERRDREGEGKDWKDFKGFTANDVKLDSGLGWAERYLIRKKYNLVAQTIEGLRKHCQDLIEAGGMLASIKVDSLEGKALADSGKKLERAEQLLSGVLEKLSDFQPEDDFDRWECRVIEAETHNSLGYLYRTMGRYRQAIGAYRDALPVWHELVESTPPETLREAMKAQQANTLNNLSWALAETGKFQMARRICEDALQMRRKLGPLAPVAFSLNTLGMIQTRNDNPYPGSENCKKALDIFMALHQPRGVGLACIARAEALRRYSWDTIEHTPFEAHTEFLKDAASLCDKAISIFGKEVQEKPRLIEALLEQGCVYRNWAVLQKHYKRDDPSPENLASQSESAFQRGVNEGRGEEKLAYKVVDLYVNLAWLYFYIGKVESVPKTLEKAFREIPEEYFITEKNGLPKEDLPQTFFWVQLGKGHLLKGELEAEGYKREGPFEPLERAVQHYTLSMAYDELYAPDFRDMRRGMDIIYKRLKVIPRKVIFPQIYKTIDETSDKYKLQKPTRLRQFLEEAFGLF